MNGYALQSFLNFGNHRRIMADTVPALIRANSAAPLDIGDSGPPAAAGNPGVQQYGAGVPTGPEVAINPTSGAPVSPASQVSSPSLAAAPVVHVNPSILGYTQNPDGGYSPIYPSPGGNSTGYGGSPNDWAANAANRGLVIPANIPVYNLSVRPPIQAGGQWASPYGGAIPGSTMQPTPQISGAKAFSSASNDDAAVAIQSLLASTHAA